MKCITLTQPWASLIAVGAKKIETRSWNTNYRGPLAIHAALKFPMKTRWLLARDPFRSEFIKAGYHIGPLKNLSWLPLGAVVATCELADIVPTETAIQFDYGLSDEEIKFGDYSPGRWAWRLDNVKKLPEPIPAKGALRLWETDAQVSAALLDSLWKER
jgi:hypothetical protein